MTRGYNQLTALFCRQQSEDGLYNDGGGLWLRVRGGSKSWIFRYHRRGKASDCGLGSLNTISLAEARKLALECRQMVLKGLDPITERRRQRQPARTIPSFQKCAEAYLTANSSGWHNAHYLHHWRRSMEIYVYPQFGDRLVSEIDTPDVMAVLTPVWNEKPHTAGRLRHRIQLILEAAKTTGYRSGDNPARWVEHLENLLPHPEEVRAVKHYAAVAWDQMPELMVRLRAMEGVVAAALELLILTVARGDEIRGAPWDEFNLPNGLWVIPAERMKTGKEHRVPLTEAALTVLTRVEGWKGNDFVFPKQMGGRNRLWQFRDDGHISACLMPKLLKNKLGKHSFTVHGLRSTFRDWAAECTNFPREIAEMCLAHTVGSEIERAYRRSDLLERRRQLLEAWARYLDEPVAGVVPLRTAQS